MCQVGRMQIAEKVKQFRLNNKLKREELSLKLGMDNSYISKLERGRINIPIDRLEQLADFMNIKLADFFSQ